jgi:hypothetical protein
VLRVKSANYIKYEDEAPSARVLIEDERRQFYGVSKRSVISLPFVLVLHVPAKEAKAMEAGEAEAFIGTIEEVERDTYEIKRKGYLAEQIGETALFVAHQTQGEISGLQPIRHRFRLVPLDMPRVYLSKLQLRRDQASGLAVAPVRRMTDPDLYA